MIGVVLVDVFRDFSVIKRSFDQLVNFLDCRFVSRSRHNLQNLVDFDLKPRTRCHVVVVIGGVIIYAPQNFYQWLNKLLVPTMSEQVYRAEQQSAT